MPHRFRGKPSASQHLDDSQIQVPVGYRMVAMLLAVAALGSFSIRLKATNNQNWGLDCR